MTYFPDLAPYACSLRDEQEPVAGLRHVGWLEGGHEFTRGTIQRAVPEKLREQCARNLVVQEMRGTHPCSICGADETWLVTRLGRHLLGSAELWTPGEGVWYAAPTLIVHYIEAHEYRPPPEYCAAVLACDLDVWSAPKELLSLLRN
jgi:hypothetical protein